VPAAATLSALRPATTYHYRLVATNAGGAAKGADRTFTTAALPTPFAGVRLLGRRLAYRHLSIGLELGCPAGTVGACAGRVKLTARKVRLGRASFAIAPGHQVRVKLRVSRPGRRLLQRVHRLRATATSVARDGAGHAATTVAKVKIRRR